MQVHVVDGTYELFRAFYGAPSARTADGREVEATQSLLHSRASAATDGSERARLALPAAGTVGRPAGGVP